MGGSIGRKKKPKKFKKGKVKVSKSFKKKVKMVEKTQWQFLRRWIQNYAGQLSSAVNKVAWTGLFTPTAAALRAYAQNEQMLTLNDGDTELVTQEPADVTSTGAFNKYFVKCRLKYYFKNNSTSHCNVILYTVRALTSTNNTFVTNLNNQITNAWYTTTQTAADALSAPLAKEDNFGQYAYVRGAQKSVIEWKVKSYQTFRLAGGDELTVTVDLNNPFDMKGTIGVAYQKGEEHLYARVMGAPSHDTTTKTNVGVADTLVDYIVCQEFSCYKKEQSVQAANQVTLANSNFSAITVTVAGDAEAGAIQK